MNFEKYATKPVIVKAHRLTPNDIAAIEHLPAPFAILDGITFTHSREPKAGDCIIILAPTDIYHCKQDVFDAKYKMIKGDDIMPLNTVKTITISEYERLKDLERWVDALNAAGVHNWGGIDIAFDIKEEGERE